MLLFKSLFLVLIFVLHWIYKFIPLTSSFLSFLSSSIPIFSFPLFPASSILWWCHPPPGLVFLNLCFCCLITKSCSTLATPWTVAHQAPPSMGFSRQEYWSGLPFPSPGNLPDPGIEPRSPTLQADALTSEPPGKGKVNTIHFN